MAKPNLAQVFADVDLNGATLVKTANISSGNDNIYDLSTKLIVGRGIGADGSPFTTAGYGSMIGVPVEPNTYYVFNNLINSRGAGVGLRLEDSGGNRLILIPLIASGQPFLTPPNCKQLSMQVYNTFGTQAEASSITLQAGQFAGAFIPYGEPANYVSKINTQGISADKIKIGTGRTPVIVPDPTFALTNFNTVQKTINTWYFAKSVKTISKVGVYFYKHNSTGDFTKPAFVQIIVKRAGSADNVILNTSVSVATLKKFNTPGLVNPYAYYELVLDLPKKFTLAVGDIIFITQQSDDGLYPVYGNNNALLSSGEWNDGLFCYRAWNIALNGTYTSVPALPATNANYNAVNFYDSYDIYDSSEKISQRLTNVEQNVITGAGLDFEVLAPANIYFGNTSVNGRKEALITHLQYYLRDKAELYIDGKLSQLILSKNNVNTATVDQETISFTIGGVGFMNKTVSMNRISTNVSVLQSAFPKVIYMGDSISTNRPKNGVYVGAGSLWAMAKEIALKNYTDNGNAGYNYLCIGTANMAGNSVPDSPFTYKGNTINLRGFAEGVGGYQTCTWLRHPIRMWVTPAGGWDLLGLVTTQGRAYTATEADKLLMMQTCYGVNTPVVSANSYAILVAELQIATNLGAWTGAANQITAVQNWINAIAAGGETQNKFFDITKTGTNRFNVTRYLAKHKTLADDGVTRLVVGSTAGTFVTNATACDVCTMTHAIVGTGENDRLFSTNYVVIADNVMELANEWKNQVAGIKVTVVSTQMPSPMWPERFPKYKGVWYPVHHSTKYLFYKELSSRFSTSIATQNTNRIYLAPCWHFMNPASNVITSEQIDEGTGEVIQVGVDDYNHPGYYSLRAGGSQIYWWIAYTLTI